MDIWLSVDLPVLDLSLLSSKLDIKVSIACFRAAVRPDALENQTSFLSFYQRVPQIYGLDPRR